MAHTVWAIQYGCNRNFNYFGNLYNTVVKIFDWYQFSSWFDNDSIANELLPLKIIDDQFHSIPQKSVHL